MATINYNGMELEEVTTPQIFDPPKMCVVWDENNEERARADKVSAILPQYCYNARHVVTSDGRWYNHCALLTDTPKPRMATNRELARWLAQGNGQVSYFDEYGTGRVSTSWTYISGDLASPTDEVNDEGMSIRKWEDTEWHEPTVEYMGLELPGRNDGL